MAKVQSSILALFNVFDVGAPIWYHIITIYGIDITMVTLEKYLKITSNLPQIKLIPQLPQNTSLSRTLEILTLEFSHF